ncbi:MAG: acyl-CoA dehydrogenase family protein, partial [Pseudomonadota bacterium]
MDFQLTDDQRELKETARKFARSELTDLAREMEEKDYPVPHDMLRTYGEMGFLGVNLPTEYGGLGLGHLEALLVLEEFAQVSNAVAFPVFEALTGPVRTIDRFGSDEMKARVLPEVIKGEKIVAVSMSEPDAGTALTDLKTKAAADGNGYVVNGYKRWTSGGGHSDYYVTYARFSDDPGAKGIGAILLEKDMEGMEFGKREELMGFRGIPTADFAIDNVKVPGENVIIGAGGFGKLMSAFGLERCGNATQALGVAAAALEQALEYTQEREAFGKPIVDFQAVQLKIADMAMKVDAARLLIHRAAINASAQDDGLPTVYESSLAKCFANEMVRDVAALGMQVMGGYGYHKDYGMEQRLRDAY